MQKQHCIFCNILTNNLKQVVISERPSFWITYDGFPIADPHFLIIPKIHRSNYGKVHLKQFKEIKEILEGLRTIIHNNLFVFEHGEIGQSVKHAHLHVISLDIPLNTIIKELHIPGEKRALNKIEEIKNYKQYFFFLEKNKPYIFIPNDLRNIPIAPITNTIAKLLHMSFPASERKPVDNILVQKYKSLQL